MTAHIIPLPRSLYVSEQDNAYGFGPVSDLPRARFHPADDGAVRLGVTRLCPEIVEELLRLFERERAWGLFDDLCAAVDGIVEPPTFKAAKVDWPATPYDGARDIEAALATRAMERQP